MCFTINSNALLDGRGSIIGELKNLVPVEVRLQNRYQQLVIEQLNTGQGVAAGLRAIPSPLRESFASTQAAWRFYANESITLMGLSKPIISYGLEALSQSNAKYAIMIYDWSYIDYKNHNSKQDRIEVNNSQTLGYELVTALLISDKDGSPVAPLCHELLSENGYHSSCNEQLDSKQSHLDRLTQTMKYVKGLGLSLPVVSIIDREADSVGHYRLWNKEIGFFIIRANDKRIVKHQGVNKSLSKVVADLKKENEFNYIQDVEIKGKIGKQYVAETKVILDRPARRNRKGEKEVSIPGEPIELRFIVSEVMGENGELLAQWRLFSNLPNQGEELKGGVSAEEIAIWYYWRWKIESFFKLLKSAGFHMEEWQQETASAIAKRLLVISMSCVVVWNLARSKQPEAVMLRKLLVKLSGRQMKRGQSFTEPALLSGLWVFLSMLEILNYYEVEQLRHLSQFLFLFG